MLEVASCAAPGMILSTLKIVIASRRIKIRVIKTHVLVSFFFLDAIHPLPWGGPLKEGAPAG